MDDEVAADYAATLPEHCKALILKASPARWTGTGNLIAPTDDPFASGKQIAHYLESANLAEVRQGRTGNKFGSLVVRLNERGAYLKQFMTAQQEAENGKS